VVPLGEVEDDEVVDVTEAVDEVPPPWAWVGPEEQPTSAPPAAARPAKRKQGTSGERGMRGTSKERRGNRGAGHGSPRVTMTEGSEAEKHGESGLFSATAKQNDVRSRIALAWRNCSC
jgi:hypothetical protein